ncbi:MAG: DUF2461 family protein, partial [Lysobacteraceae bacterium]
MSIYFEQRSLRFLQQLADNNNKTWFDQHRSDYERFVREPFLRLIADLQPAL